jgi:hypothetical protein
MEKRVVGRYKATRVMLWSGIVAVLGMVVSLTVILLSAFNVYPYLPVLNIIVYIFMGLTTAILLLGILFYDKLAGAGIEYIKPEDGRDILRLKSLFTEREFKGPFYFNAYIQSKQKTSFEEGVRKYPAYFRIDIKITRSKRISILERIPEDTELPSSRRIEARTFWEPDYRSTKRFPGPLWELYKALK